jgi:DNA (cytosine-5)-methyltransferase 1
MSDDSDNGLIFLGGLSIWLDNGKHFSRNFRSGARVYSTKGVGACISALGGGLAGAGGALYLVKTEDRQEEKGI